MVGIYAAYLGVQAALSASGGWPEIGFALAFPAAGVLLGGVLAFIGWRGVRQPDMATVVCIGIAAWFVLSYVLWELFNLLTPWIVEDRVDPYRSIIFNVAFLLAALVSVITTRKLAKASGLLDRDAHWWNRHNIRTLCGLVSFGLFLAMAPAFETAREWIVPAGRHALEMVLFAGWLVLMLLVYRLGPPLLMWLIPPRQPAPFERPEREREPPVSSFAKD